MRLLYLSADPGVPVFGGKGASVHLRALVSALDAAGHELLVASPRLEPGANALADGVATATIPAVRPRECATPQEVSERCRAQAEAVERLAREHASEGIYERYSLMGAAGARVAVRLGLPLAVEVNAPLREEERRFRELAHEPLALAAERETFAAADRIFVVSAALRDWLLEQGVAPAKLEVMGNAPPVHAFPPDRRIATGPELVVGFSGGLKRWHGIGTLVEGVRHALAAGARIRLEIVGQGPADELLDRCELPPDRLLRLGAVSHQQALARLERWDVGVAPFSAMPGFWFSPLKLFEYMAAGLCPVVSDVGELAEIVEHGRAGVIVAPEDPGALGEALRELDRDRQRVRELAARARRAAAAHPGWGHSAERAVAALQAAASQVGAAR